MRKQIMPLFFIIFSFILILRNDAIAQTWEWASTAWGRTGIEIKSITTDSGGNSYITGNLRGDLDFGKIKLKKKNEVDVFIAKFNSSGKNVWAKNFGGGYQISTGEGIVTDTKGNVYLTGYYTAASITFGAVKLSGGEGFIVKFDTAGNALWGKSFWGEFYGITTDYKDNVYITGFIKGSKYDNIVITKCEGINFFIAKYNSSGKLIWAKGTCGGVGHCISSDKNGNVFVAGTYRDENLILGKDTFSTFDKPCFFVAKYDTSGSVIWAKGPRKGGKTIPKSIVTDSKGCVLITGEFRTEFISFDNIKLEKEGETVWMEYAYADAFLVKYDADGNALWAKNIGGTKDDVAIGVVCDSNDNVFVAGDFQSPEILIDSTKLININTEPNADSPSANIFITKYNAAGTNTWSMGLPTPGFINCLAGICIDPENSILLTGEVASWPIKFGAFTVLHKENNYLFVSKLNFRER